MALSMNTSSIGVSSSGMKRVRDEIQMNLIDESIKSFNGGCKNLIDNVDTYWHGASANAFKIKINTDRAKLETILRVIEEKMEIDLGVMATNTAIADAEVATSLYGLAGEGGSSSVVPQATTGTTPEKADTSMARDILDKIDDMWNLKPNPNNSVDPEYIDVDYVPDYMDSIGDNILLGLKKTGASIISVGESALKGFSSATEGIIDTGAQAATGVASVFTGAYDGITYVGSKITGKEWHSVTADMWEGTRAFVAHDMTGTLFNRIDETDFQGEVKRWSYPIKPLNGIAQGAGAGVATGAFSSTLFQLTGGKGDLNKFNIGTAMAVGFGKSSQIAYQNDLSQMKAMGFSIENAASAGAKEYVSQGIDEIVKVGTKQFGPITVDKSITDKAARKGPKTILGKVYNQAQSSMYESAGIDYDSSKGTGDEVVPIAPNPDFNMEHLSRLNKYNINTDNNK